MITALIYFPGIKETSLNPSLPTNMQFFCLWLLIGQQSSVGASALPVNQIFPTSKRIRA